MLTRVPLQHEEHSVVLFIWTNESQVGDVGDTKCRERAF